MGFLNQCVYYNITLTFAKVRGTFATIRDKQQVGKKIVKRQLMDHHNNLKCLRIKHLELSSNLFQLVSKVIFRVLLRNISNSLRMSNIQQLRFLFKFFFKNLKYLIFLLFPSFLKS